MQALNTQCSTDVSKCQKQNTKEYWHLGVVAYTFNSNTREAKAGSVGSRPDWDIERVPGLPGLYRDLISENNYVRVCAPEYRNRWRSEALDYQVVMSHITWVLITKSSPLQG